MKKTSSNPGSNLDRIRSWTRTTLHGNSDSSTNANPTLPINNHPRRDESTNLPPFASEDLGTAALPISNHTSNDVADNTASEKPTGGRSSQVEGEGAVVNNEEVEQNVAKRFYLTAKAILLSSYINLLLVFVPIGIASHLAHLNAGVTFAMNAIAIIPLAGLLSYATESVAHRMGDTVGALMNVSFGNAVELIIFIIALTENKIRIVQAALLGSILANLLLILGMCFLIGGLRYREQIYNSTVTQMSACLLSLAVMSLLLPTAFHASFNVASKEKAERAVLKVSRGTSVILLIVYGMYLLFQLKSHAYMYQSTPQHILDEEMAPGPVAAWMDTSSDSSSSFSSSDSDSSSNSNTTRRRFKRVMKGGRRQRKMSVGSKDSTKAIKEAQESNVATGTTSPTSPEETGGPSKNANLHLPTLDTAEDGDDEKKASRRGSKSSRTTQVKERKKDRKRREKRERKARREAKRNGNEVEKAISEKTNQPAEDVEGTRRVDFAVENSFEVAAESDATSRRPFNFRSITNLRPQLPVALSQNVFTQSSPKVLPVSPVGPVPRVRYGIRRTNSLPIRLDETSVPVRRHQFNAPASDQSQPVPAKVNEVDAKHLSRTSAVLLLLISTGLVALCADFLVESIDAVVASGSGISEVFIGLIILPLVGNAAEHVTAVTVATKNKMDLAIGVAVGSSIQIALFITPFVVLLGWCMDKEMTLYFTLFETVSLFVSAFVVNFMVLDGRSNYLEGALLCASYVIIAVAAAFYPNEDDQSNLGGNAEAVSRMVRSLAGV